MGAHTALEVNPSTPLHTLMLLDPHLLLLRLLSPNNQSQLLFKLTNLSSTTTPVVSSLDPHAEPNSTMVSSLSDMELNPDKITTLSRTPGEPPGEKVDTSDSELRMDLVSVVSKCRPPTQPPTELRRLCLNSFDKKPTLL